MKPDETMIVAFTGHMIDKVGRIPPRFVPRFPREKERSVTVAISRTLDRLNARVGYCSAACGADIIFLEQMLKRGGEVNVVLPYGEEQFIRDCVKSPDSAGPNAQFQENRGKEWLPRFQGIRKRVASLIILGKQRPQDNAIASDGCNRVFLGLGLLRASSEAKKLRLIALWDGWSGDAPGGTRSLVKLADSLGVRTAFLPQLRPRRVSQILRAAAPPPGINAQPERPTVSNEPIQELRAVLFADVMRFSKLDEARLPGFVTGYLQPLGNLIQVARHGGYGPLDFNTWGDGLYCVFDTMLKAGKFALEMQKLTESGKWSLGRKRRPIRLRIALHAGPVYRIPDPIFPRDTFFGTNISFAARIEPATEPGQVYCSQTFAAFAACEGVRDFVCDPIGKKRLPKGAGTHPLYALRQESALC
jgi:class 3 adenylate cyclase